MVCILILKKAFKDFLDHSNRANVYMDCPEPRRIAAGILKLCKITSPELTWAPINYQGKDVLDALKSFFVMPKA
jgi:hypothetical protein